MLKEIKKIIFRSSYILRKNEIRHNDFFKDTKNNLIGGGNKILSINYNDNIYNFEESEIDDNHFILYSYEENPLDCVSIIISKEDKIAEIHGIFLQKQKYNPPFEIEQSSKSQKNGIGNYEKCLQNSNTNIGSTLLKITIKMLKKYKDKLGINMITLTDNSIKSCKKNNIILSKMLILLTGDTWYGKYGFRPYDIQVKSINDTMNNKYNKNKKIMSKITIKDANILKHISRASARRALARREGIVEDIKKLLAVQPNMLVTVFLSQFLKNYDKTCKYFSLFYEDLFEDLQLTDFYKQSFAMKL